MSCLIWFRSAAIDCRVIESGPPHWHWNHARNICRVKCSGVILASFFSVLPVCRQCVWRVSPACILFLAQKSEYKWLYDRYLQQELRPYKQALIILCLKAAKKGYNYLLLKSLLAWTSDAMLATNVSVIVKTSTLRNQPVDFRESSPR